MAAGVLSLPSAVLNKLVQRLEISSPLGRDWKGLAAVLGFNSRHTLFIEERSSSRSRTSLLLSAWDRSGRSSVEKLVLALYCLPHEGCLRILRPELPGREREREREREGEKSVVGVCYIWLTVVQALTTHSWRPRQLD